MNTTFLPFQHDNPYQTLLARSLEGLGVNIRPIGDNILQLPFALKKNNIEILHLHWLHPFFVAKSDLWALARLTKFILVLLLVRLMGTKIVWTVHNLEDHEKQNAVADHISTYVVARLANRLIAHCNKAAEEIARKCRLEDKGKIATIPHGHYIDAYQNSVSHTDARSRLKLSPDDTLLMFFGSIRPYKGVPQLIREFARLPADGVKLMIVGRSNHKHLNDSIEQLVTAANNVLFFRGFVADDEIQLYMNAADAVVFPYKDILTSGAVMLAMSFGKACIAPRLGCIGETLDDEGAFLYDVNEEDALSTALQAAVAAKDALERMGAHNLEKARRYDWHQIGQSTLRAYRGER